MAVSTIILNRGRYIEAKTASSDTEFMSEALDELAKRAEGVHMFSLGFTGQSVFMFVGLKYTSTRMILMGVPQIQNKTALFVSTREGTADFHRKINTVQLS